MSIVNNIGFILLSVWLVGSGVIVIFGLEFPSRSLVMAFLAIIAGILILFRIRDSKASINLGMLLLSLWLMLTGLFGLFGAAFPAGTIFLAVLGLGAGVLLLIGQ
ncbi:MAG: hypothetical protein M1281_04925 [Chloroflexi bacterium]|nr:hypothetical protein [Chloroflexota bacterium]